MQNNFEAKHIKNAKEALSQDMNIARRHLNNYKKIQEDLLKERFKEFTKEPSLWQKIATFFNKYV